ncbi:hypothetical protein CRUP_029880 [Coryphaenoides rupestris]|nr:hypothetical protein CRUP_029880 [Coryphaenoides rupestris]
MSLLDAKALRQRAERPPALKSHGTLRAELRSFYSSRSPPQATKLGQPVYVDVHLLKGEDGDLVLLLDDCWATPTQNPDDPLRWNLLVKRNEEVRYPSHHKRFATRIFSFVNVPPGVKRLNEYYKQD